MKQNFKSILKLFFLLCAFIIVTFSCNRSDDKTTTDADEYITWKNSGTDYKNGTIYKYYDSKNFEISESTHNFFLEVKTSTPIIEGMIINASETSTELSFGFDSAGNSDLYFYGGYVKFTTITNNYIEGEFVGNNAKIVDDSVSPATVTSSSIQITNGKFRIKR